MIYATKGIVLNSIDYSESSIILKAYTELYGMQSFIIKGFTSPRSKFRKSFFQPLSILEIVAYPNPRGEIHLVKDLSPYYHPKTLYIDVKKIAIVFYLNELIFRSIKEQEPNKQLYDFLIEAIEHLDMLKDEDVLLFAIYFSLQLCRFMGFLPEQNSFMQNMYFDLLEGTYKSEKPEHAFFIDQQLTPLFQKLTIAEFDNYQFIQILNTGQFILLKKICDYYAVHVSGLNKIKSMEFLEKIFE
jgi:DNA repair protein RecO (recombination protein O)